MDSFEKSKVITKELLFSGADRNIKNLSGKTALDILETDKDSLELEEYLKMQYILTPPGKCTFLTLRRPIEKVERSKMTQISMLIFDFINLGFFIVAASFNQHLKLNDTAYNKE